MYKEGRILFKSTPNNLPNTLPCSGFHLFLCTAKKTRSWAMKIQKQIQTITPFAGVFFVIEEFNNCSLSSLIGNSLGAGNLSGYQYGDIIRGWFSVFFSGGDVAEGINCHQHDSLACIPGNRVPSADTLLCGIKELATGNQVVKSTRGKEYQFNINHEMSDLNVKSLLLTKQLRKGQFYDFDYDSQIIEHEKYDAKRTYKHNTGYFPEAATIGDKIVYSTLKIATATPT
jgi:hypothetical protein